MTQMHYFCSECERPLADIPGCPNHPDAAIDAKPETPEEPINWFPPESEEARYGPEIDEDAPIPYRITGIEGASHLLGLIQRADDQLAEFQRRCGSCPQIDAARSFLTKALETL